MKQLPSRRVVNAVGFLACVALIGYALYAQYVVGLDPCPLCLFQRFAVIGLGVGFLLALLHNPGDKGARVYAVVQVILALVGIGIAARHLYIQSLPPGSVPACGAGLSYLMDIMPLIDVIKKVFTGSGECQHVDTLLGLSWPWWTAITMTLLGIWGGVGNWLERSVSPRTI